MNEETKLIQLQFLCKLLRNYNTDQLLDLAVDDHFKYDFLQSCDLKSIVSCENYIDMMENISMDRLMLSNAFCATVDGYINDRSIRRMKIEEIEQRKMDQRRK